MSQLKIIRFEEFYCNIIGSLRYGKLFRKYKEAGWTEEKLKGLKETKCRVTFYVNGEENVVDHRIEFPDGVDIYPVSSDVVGDLLCAALLSEVFNRKVEDCLY